MHTTIYVKTFAVIKIAVLLGTGIFWSTSWSFSLFGPSDYEECKASAAKDAKTESALKILIDKCDTDFPARKGEQGGYFYFDSDSRQWIEVSSAKMSKTDWSKVNQARSDYAKAQELKNHRAAEARAQQEKSAEEQRKLQANKNAEALSKVSVQSVAISCDGSYICINRHFTIKLKNASSFDIKRIGLGILVTTDPRPDCSGSHAEDRRENVDLRAGGLTSINITHDPGPNKVDAKACIWVTSVSVSD